VITLLVFIAVCVLVGPLIGVFSVGGYLLWGWLGAFAGLVIAFCINCATAE
jgi:hypothetical protein